MGLRTRSVLKEPDETAAPFVFIYIFLVLGWLIVALAWVFWLRGYA
jgi:hypothetical protein